MNFKHLHYFWRVDKAGGVARAGEKLQLKPRSLTGQSGMPDVAMEALTDSRLIKSARSAAKEGFGKDPSLRDYPLLKARLAKFEKEIHFE